MGQTLEALLQKEATHIDINCDFEEIKIVSGCDFNAICKLVSFIQMHKSCSYAKHTHLNELLHKWTLKENEDINVWRRKQQMQKSHSGQVSSGQTVDGERSRRRRLMMPDHGTQLGASTCITKYSS